MIGKTISHYKILEKVGEGGMGIVYKAEDTFLYRLIAIKTLPSSLVNEPEFIKRFIQEARTASSLNHPNICTVHDVIEENNQYYIVMEYVEGETLRELLDKRGPLPVREVLDIGIKICDALKAAHTKHIIHRDIKPENIMIADDGNLKIMDFGLAKLRYEKEFITKDFDSGNGAYPESDLYKTSLSNILGTVSYMAPEQIENKPINERTDLYSVGVVLYELLAGKQPFIGKDKIEILEKILEVEPEPFSDSGNNILNPIILKALAKLSADRYENIENLCLQLENIQKKLKSNWFSKNRNFIYGGLVLLLSGIFILFGSLNFLKNDNFQFPEIFKIYPLGIVSKSVEWPSFFPDSEHIIYTSSIFTETNDLIKRNFLTGEEKKLFQSYSLRMPDLSPIGSQIVSTSNRGIEIRNITTKKVIKISDFGYHPKWSPEGNKIVFSSSVAQLPGTESSVYLYSLKDSSLIKISPDNGLNYTDPKWTSDKQLIVCAGGSGSIWEIWLINIDTGEANQLTNYGNWCKNPVCSISEPVLYFISNRSGTMNIWCSRLNIKERKLEGNPFQVTTGLDVEGFDISKDNKKIVFTQKKKNQEIRRMPLHPKIMSVAQDSKLIMGELGIVHNLEVSQSGEKIVAEAFYGGFRSLIVKTLIDNSEPVIYRKKEAYAPNWSPDEKYIAFDAGGGDKADIWQMTSDGKNVEKLVNNPGADWLPTVSSDGKFVCFLSNRSGNYDLWVQNFQTGKLIQITKTADVESRGAWSNDGCKLAFFQNGLNNLPATIKVYDFINQTIVEIIQIEGNNNYIMLKIVWKVDNSGFYYLYSTGLPLMEISLTEKIPKPVLDFQKYGFKLSSYAFDIHNDLVYFVTGEEISEVKIAELQHKH